MFIDRQTGMRRKGERDRKDKRWNGRNMWKEEEKRKRGSKVRGKPTWKTGGKRNIERKGRNLVNEKEYRGETIKTKEGKKNQEESVKLKGKEEENYLRREKK